MSAPLILPLRPLKTNPVAEAAREYIAAGFCPIPVPPGSKNPARDGWQNERWTISDVAENFPPNSNVGLLVAVNGNNRIDVDCDCREAVRLAPEFLPQTGVIHGRSGSPRSHPWYTVIDPSPEFLSLCDTECTRDDPHGTKLVELRYGKGHQTLVPPSIHPSGEAYTWDEREGVPTAVAGDVLSVAVRELAAAALTVRHYPKQGYRHDFALALAGFLLHQRWDVNRVSHFIEVAAKEAGDDEWQDRATAVRTSATRLAAGETNVGGTRLREIWGGLVLDRFCEFLQFSKSSRLVLPAIEAASVVLEKIDYWPVAALEGDCIADLTHALADETGVPPQFLREEINLVLGALTEGKIGFPQHRGLPTRRYLALISERAQSCKGESWLRTAGNTPEGGALRPLLDADGVTVLTGAGIGSGQYLAKELQSTSRAIVHWDETTGFFAQTGMQNSTLLSVLKSLFEGNSAWTGSLTNKKFGTDDARLSVLLHSTRKSFAEGFKLRGGLGDGLLSRFTLVYSAGMPAVPVWRERAFAEEKRIVKRIAGLIPERFLPLAIDAHARGRFTAFASHLLSPDHPHPDHVRRILELMKVDIILRAVFSDSTGITTEMVDRSIAWGEHQLRLRLAFWPPDATDKTEAMTKSLLNRLKKGSASACDLRTAANVHRDGSHETFSRALTALKRSGELIVLGKNRKGHEIYGLDAEDSEKEVTA